MADYNAYFIATLRENKTETTNYNVNMYQPIVCCSDKNRYPLTKVTTCPKVSVRIQEVTDRYYKPTTHLVHHARPHRFLHHHRIHLHYHPQYPL